MSNRYKHPARLIQLLFSILASFPLQSENLILFTSEDQSFTIQVMEKYVREAGFHPTIKTAPLARVAEEMRLLRADGAFFLSQEWGASIPGAHIVPVPLYVVDHMAVTVDPDFAGLETQELKSLTFGAERGNLAHRLIGEDLKEVFWTRDLTMSVRMLQNRRFQVAVIPRPVIKGIMNLYDIVTYKIHEPPLISFKNYLILGSEAERFRPALTATLRKAVDSGRWKADIEAVIRNQIR